MERKVLPIGSPEAAAAIRRVRDQERLRKGMDTFGRDSYKASTKLTPKLREKIKKMLSDGMTRKQIARITGISYSTVARIDVGIKQGGKKQKT